MEERASSFRKWLTRSGLDLLVIPFCTLFALLVGEFFRGYPANGLLVVATILYVAVRKRTGILSRAACYTIKPVILGLVGNYLAGSGQRSGIGRGRT